VRLFGAMLMVGCLLLPSLPSEASLVTVSLPGGTLVPQPVVDYFGPGPITFGPGITWSSTNAVNQGGSVFGYDNGYGFGDNGFWNGPLGPMVGLNDSFDASGVADTMTFRFSTPVSGVGGFFNYVPGGSTPTTIAVYDSLNNQIEASNLTFTVQNAPNLGMFLGFSETAPIISYFTLTDNYIALADLTVVLPVAAPVPEPGSMTLLGLGLLGSAFVRRR
jgi:PEP-CTERM motif